MSTNGEGSGGYALRPRGKHTLTEPTIPPAKCVCVSSSNVTEGHRSYSRGHGGSCGGGQGRGRGRDLNDSHQGRGNPSGRSGGDESSRGHYWTQ